ncbi:MAG: hypothetical protein QXD11_02220 [Candidatus Micrarchaeaceae archaeon]
MQNASEERLYALSISFAFILSFAIIATVYCISMRNAMQAPQVLQPTIMFYVNSTPPLGMTFVPLNQTFCPENSTVMKEAASLRSFPYYTQAGEGEEFAYNFAYNGSYSILGVVANPPFKVVRYSIVSQGGACQGATNMLHIVIEAPNSTYTGKIILIIYKQVV